MNASRENAALWEKPIGRGIVHRGFPIEMRPLHRIHSGQGTEDGVGLLSPILGLRGGINLWYAFIPKDESLLHGITRGTLSAAMMAAH